MQTLSEIKSLLATRGIRPKHRFGQNFLHDHNLLRKLVEAARVRADELVVEVGPGTGTLTETLLDAGADVVACEIDPDMQGIVEERVAARPEWATRFRLVRDDCLAGKRALSPELLAAIAGRRFALVANLPYAAATPLMAVLATRYPECRGQYVTVQREVADRLRAGPGSRDYGPLGVIVQLHATVRQIAVARPGCFWPEPDVTSAMVAIEPLSERPFATPERLDRFEAFLHLVFSKRRKQLGSILGAAGRAGAARAWPDGVLPSMRPEELAPATLVELERLVADASTREA